MLFSFQNCGKMGDSTELITTMESVDGSGAPVDGSNPDDPADNPVIPPQEEPDPGLTNEDRQRICKSYLDNGYTPRINGISSSSVNFYVGQDGDRSGNIEPQVDIDIQQNANATMQSVEIRCELQSDNYADGENPINCDRNQDNIRIQRRQRMQHECAPPGQAVYKISLRGICNNETNGTSDDNGTSTTVTVNVHSNCPMQTKVDSGLPNANQRLGDSVDFDGSYLAAGYPGDASGGGVKLYEKLSNRLEYRGEETLSANVVGLAVDGNYLAVGTPFAGSGGEVKVYNISSGNFGTVQTLTARSSSEEFGHAISIDGNVMVVGAPNNRISGNFASSGSGAIHIYELSGGNWNFVNSVSLPNRGDSSTVNKHLHNFGYSVDVDNGVIVAGAPVDEKTMSPDKDGSIHIIQKSGSSYQITNSKTIGKRFGSSVAISGSRILAAAEINDRVHVYNMSLSKTSELRTRPDSGGATVKRVTVSIDGSKAAVGVLHDSGPNTLMYSGATYYYDLNQSGKVFKSIAMDRENDQAKYGSDVAIKGNIIAVGSREDDLNTDNGDSVNRSKAGSVYLLDVSSTYLKVLSDQ